MLHIKWPVVNDEKDSLQHDLNIGMANMMLTIATDIVENSTIMPRSFTSRWCWPPLTAGSRLVYLRESDQDLN